jgi:hypothetical protein
VAAIDSDGRLIAVGADDEARGMEVDGPEPFLHGRPIDDDFDMGTYRERAAAAKPYAGGTKVAYGSRAPSRGSTPLGNTEMNWHVNGVAFAGTLVRAGRRRHIVFFPVQADGAIPRPSGQLLYAC